jgi:hypothetical protein
MAETVLLMQWQGTTKGAAPRLTRAFVLCARGAFTTSNHELKMEPVVCMRAFALCPCVSVSEVSQI